MLQRDKTAIPNNA